jgi:hypothetical protein
MTMSCRLCSSQRQTEFRTEMIVHFSGLKNVDQAGVLAFPMISVCLDCGLADFRLAEAELALLADRTCTNPSIRTRIVDQHRGWTRNCA